MGSCDARLVDLSDELREVEHFFEKFIEYEEREMDSEDPNKQNLKYVISQADFHITNDGSLEELQKRIE